MVLQAISLSQKSWIDYHPYAHPTPMHRGTHTEAHIHTGTQREIAEREGQRGRGEERNRG